MKVLREKLTKIVQVRYTPSEHALLTKVQGKTSFTLSKLIRKVTLEKAPTIIDKETAKNYKEVLRLCKIISNNINQISKAHNAFTHTKVHFSKSTRQAIVDTLYIMQLWRDSQTKMITPPGK